MVDLHTNSKSESSSSTVVESNSRHNYFTRLSARHSQINLLNNQSPKVPYVNLTNSRINLIEQTQGDFVVRSSPPPRKRDSTNLKDFTEDFPPTLVIYENPNNPVNNSNSEYCDNSIMDRRCPSRRPDSSGSLSCLSTIVVILVSTLLTSLSFMHHMKKDVGHVNNDVNQLKEEMEQVSQERIVVNDRLSKIEQLLVEIKKHITNQTDEPSEPCQSLKKIIKLELNKIDEEKTGRTDFALETSGGRIVKLVDTENYDKSGGSVLGVALCEGSHGPRTMIQPGTAPGQCWAFKGTRGSVVIKLMGSVNIDAVSMIHIPKNLSPTGTVDTAPKDFTVKGLQTISSCDNPKGSGITLGKFVYNIDGPSKQTYPVSSHVPFEYVQLSITSNYGNPHFTCVYRFQVHGILSSTDGNY